MLPLLTLISWLACTIVYPSQFASGSEIRTSGAATDHENLRIVPPR
jgi:hypothetical protein